MKLKKMFYKEIDRDIKGVIKIGQDDDTNVHQELEEYVVTRELARHFSTFLRPTEKRLIIILTKWESGYQASLVLVNPIS